MSELAGYAKRLAALPRALGILELHPGGLPLSDLAAELGVEADDLREVVLAYYRADLVELGSFDQPVVEFFAPDAEDEVDPRTAQWVRVVSRDPEQELGVDHLGAEQLGRLFAATNASLLSSVQAASTPQTEQGRADAGANTPGSDRTAAPAAARGDRVMDMAELERRLAALERRLDAIERRQSTSD